MLIVFTLLQGIVIGLLVSIPLGPIGLLTIKRTAIHGLRAGIIAALAVVLVDGVVASVFLLGFYQPFRQVHTIPFTVSLIGAVFVFFYGLKIFNDTGVSEVKEPKDWHHHFLGTLTMLATNPTTYVSFASIAVLLTRFIIKPLETRMFVALGFFLGALAWWITLILIAHEHRDHYLKNTTIRKIMGGIIMVLAVFTIYAQFFHLKANQNPFYHTWQNRIEKMLN